MKCCDVVGCDKKHYAKGMCKNHYYKVQYRGGDPSVNLNDKGDIIKAGCRFMSVDEYRAHVAKEYPGTTKAAETLAILDFIEARFKATQEAV